MVWIAYKAVVKTLINCVVIVLLNFDMQRIQAQLNELNQLDRIIRCIRRSYSMHPSLFQRTYTSVEHYLRQHLSDGDWLLWDKLTTNESVSTHQVQGA